MKDYRFPLSTPDFPVHAHLLLLLFFLLQFPPTNVAFWQWKREKTSPGGQGRSIDQIRSCCLVAQYGVEKKKGDKERKEQARSNGDIFFGKTGTRNKGEKLSSPGTELSETCSQYSCVNLIVHHLWPSGTGKGCFSSCQRPFKIRVGTPVSM